jgi:hypothetical protein
LLRSESGSAAKLWRSWPAWPNQTRFSPGIGGLSPQVRGGRQPLARHLKRERVVHDLAEAEKHCHGCGRDLRLIAEETSERYKYIPRR